MAHIAEPIPALKMALARAARWHGGDSPDVLHARRALRAAVAEKYIRELVAKAPPLTAEQRARLAGLLADDAL